MFLLLSREAPEHLLEVPGSSSISNVAAGHEALTGHPKLKPQDSFTGMTRVASSTSTGCLALVAQQLWEEHTCKRS